MFITMPGRSYQGTLPVPTSQELELQRYLRSHVQQLAGVIGERNIWNYENLIAAANYIESVFSNHGYTVSIQEFKIKKKIVKNIEVEIKGQIHPEKIIIVGAHYDSINGSPGADDDASGVAAVLEIARLFAKCKLACTLRLITFVNEEPPFFFSKNMGSFHYAKRSAQRRENITAMFSIESIGYYSDKPNSQKYPFPFKFFYPNTANFIGFAGNIRSRQLVRKVVSLFRQHAKFPSQGIAAPIIIPGIAWSDQWPFWHFGFPAVMVTDTVPYRNPFYHTEADTPETLDYDRTARVTLGLFKIIRKLVAYRSSQKYGNCSCLLTRRAK